MTKKKSEHAAARALAKSMTTIPPAVGISATTIKKSLRLRHVAMSDKSIKLIRRWWKEKASFRRMVEEYFNDSVLKNCATERNNLYLTNGLKNISNNCWFNSVMQALSFIITKLNGPMTSLYPEISIAGLLTSMTNNRQIDETVLSKVVRSFCNRNKMKHGEQHDCLEFYSLSGLYEILDELDIHTEIEYEIDVQCSTCDHKDTASFCSGVLHLPLRGSISTVAEAFEGTEITCVKCGSDAKQIINILTVPLPILTVICLQRSDGKRHKIEKTIHPNKVIQESVYGDSNKHSHHLMSVIAHFGNSKGGHYVSYHIDSPSSIVKCDDESISSVNEKEAWASFSCKGYLLFYTRKPNMVLPAKSMAVQTMGIIQTVSVPV